MAVPVLFRPKYILRRYAVRKGVFGPSTVWKLVAVGVVLHRALGDTFGRKPDRLGRRTLSAGQVLSIAVVAPMGRKQAKRAGVTKKTLEAAARADLAAARSAS